VKKLADLLFRGLLLVGVGSWVAGAQHALMAQASGSCTWNGTTYPDGAQLCSDIDTVWICQNGVWMARYDPSGHPIEC
jgi:hypothetical protein